MSASDPSAMGPYWRQFEIDVENCSLFYIHFFPYGGQESEAKWKSIRLFNAFGASPGTPLDLQLLDSFDALNGLFPNRVLVNFRQAPEPIGSFHLGLHVQGFESGDFVRFRTGQAAPAASITIKAWTQTGLTTVLKAPVLYQPQAHVLTW